MVKPRFHKQVREIVIELNKNGVLVKQIFENIGKKVSIRSITRWIKDFKETGEFKS